jgi:hypothetical protein
MANQIRHGFERTNTARAHRDCGRPKIMYRAAGQLRLGKIAAWHPTDLPINNHVQLRGLLPLRRLLSFAG